MTDLHEGLLQPQPRTEVEEHSLEGSDITAEPAVAPWNSSQEDVYVSSGVIEMNSDTPVASGRVAQEQLAGCFQLCDKISTVVGYVVLFLTFIVCLPHLIQDMPINTRYSRHFKTANIVENQMKGHRHRGRLEYYPNSPEEAERAQEEWTKREEAWEVGVQIQKKEIKLSAAFQRSVTLLVCALIFAYICITGIIRICFILMLECVVARCPSPIRDALCPNLLGAVGILFEDQRRTQLLTRVTQVEIPENESPVANEDRSVSASNGSHDEAANSCTICLCALRAGEKCLRLPRGHLFHDPCVDEWLERSQYCPVCRHPWRDTHPNEVLQAASGTQQILELSSVQS